MMDEGEGALDPRIQIELENLNSATDDINKLEIELEDAHTTFKRLFTESKNQLKEIGEKVGHACLEKARCYYEAVEVARQAQMQCHYQAHLFQRANEIHAAAKETVALAEMRFISHKHEWKFDQTWQEMLNHATIKVMDAENQKTEYSREHHKKAMLFHEAGKKVQELEDKYRRSIRKAQPYFEVLAQCEHKLTSQKVKVECLQKAIKEAKRAYAQSFRALEEISNEIHQQRRDLDRMINGPREPGVGAELTSPKDSNVTKLHNDDINGNNDIENSQVNFETKDVNNIANRSIDGSETTPNQWELELQASMERLNNLASRDAIFDINSCETDFCNNHLQLGTIFSNYNILKETDEELTRMHSDEQSSKQMSLSTEALTKNQGESVTSSSFNFTQSLNNSFINANFSIKKLLTKHAQLIKSNEKQLIHSNNEHSIDNDLQNNLSKEFQDCDASNEYELISENHPADHNIGNNVNDNSNSSFHPQTLDVLLASSNVAPSKSLDNIDVKLTQSSRELSSKASNDQELPILSMFKRFNSFQLSKNKSRSMINLTDDKHTKSLLHNVVSEHIQAVSVERLDQV